MTAAELKRTHPTPLKPETQSAPNISALPFRGRAGRWRCLVADSASASQFRVRAITYSGRPKWDDGTSMTPHRRRNYLVAGCLVALLVVAALFPVRNLLAAFLMFCIFFSALGLIAVVSFLFGGGVLRCYELLLDFAEWFGVRHQHP